MLRFLRILFSSLLLLLLLAAMVVYFFLRSTQPDLEGAVDVGGLGHQVTVTRNKWGVPAIEAKDLDDLFLAIGFVHAQDRLFQMDLSRRAATGRLAEIFGPAALDHDIVQRDQLLDQAITRDEKILIPELARLLASYCRGVNDFIRTQSLPPEFALLGYEPEPWRVRDCLRILKNMEQMLVDDGSELYNLKVFRALGAKNGRELLFSNTGSSIIQLEELPLIVANRSLLMALNHEREWLDNQIGSNSWVIAGSKTVSGFPILANDPHLSSRFPAYFYQIETRCPGFEVSGNTLPGLPLVIIGRNQTIGWGLTASGTDASDFYSLTVNPQNRNQYRLDGQWAEFHMVPQTIKVKNGSDYLHRVKNSIFGPVREEGGRFLAEYSVIRAPSTTVEAAWRMNRARSIGEFIAALKKLTAPAHNVVFATRDGHIGFFPAGAVPRRTKGDGSLPVAGESSRDLWMGYLPEQEKPLLIDPPKGFIVAANNPILPDGIQPIFNRHWIPSFRADRISELLQAKSRLAISDNREIQGDTFLKSAEFLLPLIKNLEIGSADARFVLDILASWDLKASEGPAPYLFYRFESALSDAIFQDHIRDHGSVDLVANRWLYRILGYPRASSTSNALLAYWADDLNTPDQEDFATIVERSLTATYREYRRELKPNLGNLNWENLHHLQYRHPLGSLFFLRPFLNRGPFTVGGGSDCVLTASFPRKGPFIVSHIAALRMILDLGHPANSLLINSSGQSGHFQSPFYDDQIPLFTAMRYRRMEERGQKLYRLRLLPASSLR